MKETLRAEWDAFWDATRSLDRQTMFILTSCVVFVFLQLTFGTKAYYYQVWAQSLPMEWQGLGEWAWWFGMQGVTGFVLPILCLVFIFKQKPREMGLGLGDWKLALSLAGAYLPLVLVGTWILSNGRDFQAHYPHYPEAARDWGHFLMYEALFLFYWMGWEYLWRGYVLFGTAKTLGYWAIFAQMIPFAILHAQKPLAEAFLSILGGLALGALCWRCRSFWIAVPIHAAQMMILDFWCSLRIRSGANGIGYEALFKAINGIGL